MHEAGDDLHAFVTGGTGFIGSNIAAALAARGIAPRVLARRSSGRSALEGVRCEIVQGDVLEDPGLLAEKMFGCEWVFHAAGVSDYWRKPIGDVYRVNVEGTRNVLDAARRARVSRVVHTSSLAALGLPKHGEKLDESSLWNLRPASFPYGHSKHLAELEVRAALDSGLDVVIVNPSVVLGARDVHVVSGSLVVEAVRGRVPVSLPGGNNFVAVEDVVSGALAAAERGRTGRRYVIAGENLRYRDAVAVVCEVIARSPPRFEVPRWLLGPLALAVSALRVVLGNRIPLDAAQIRISGALVFADGRRAREELGVPPTPFRTAVERAYAWFAHHGYVAK